MLWTPVLHVWAFSKSCPEEPGVYAGCTRELLLLSVFVNAVTRVTRQFYIKSITAPSVLFGAVLLRLLCCVYFFFTDFRFLDDSRLFLYSRDRKILCVLWTPVLHVWEFSKSCPGKRGILAVSAWELLFCSIHVSLISTKKEPSFYKKALLFFYYLLSKNAL